MRVLKGLGAERFKNWNKERVQALSFSGIGTDISVMHMIIRIAATYLIYSPNPKGAASCCSIISDVWVGRLAVWRS